MPTIRTTVECPIAASFRVQQVAGMFDLPLAEKTRQSFTAELPETGEPWSIGVIVGPSGSGKTTIARRAFGEALYAGGDWPPDRAVVDGFGDLQIKQITRTLTAVGFSSPPSWIKPYAVLSRGEQFRCDLARALLCELPLVALDEYTSVVDRTVARFGSAAVAKSIRSGRIDKKFVAVTCHYDVADWLEADWVLDMASGTLARGRLRRPEIRLQIVRCRQSAWRPFARHHYLSGGLARGAACWLAMWNGRPVAFCAVVGMFGYKRRKRISRIVTLPDYQGLGIGARLMDRVAEAEHAAGNRASVTASHPALLAYCRRSPHWRATDVKKIGGRPGKGRRKTSRGRAVASFEFMARIY